MNMAGLHLFWALPVLAIMVLAVVGAVVLIVRAASPSPHSYPPASAGPSAPRAETPLEILARRFAAGEITAEEYQKARDMLSS